MYLDRVLHWCDGGSGGGGSEGGGSGGGAWCALLPILHLNGLLAQLLLGCLGMCLPLLLHQMQSASGLSVHVMHDLHQAVLLRYHNGNHCVACNFLP